MFRNTILKILQDSWPMVLICCVIIVSMRVVYLIKNKQMPTFYKEILGLGFIIYIMTLFYVVTFQDVSWSTSNFIPFKEMFRYDFGTRLFFKNVLGNMILFIPYGFFVSYFLKLKKPLTMFGMTFLTSITIELTQMAIGRVFDIDDILLNIVGGMLGFVVYYILEKIKDKLPNILKKTWLYNIIILVVILLMVLYLLGVFYV